MTLFAAASPASHSPSPGSNEARTMTATSGQRCYELYARFSPLGSLVRTCLASKVWASSNVYLTWKVTDSRSKHLIFRLVESTPPTDATDSGLLPTPAATDYGTNQGGAAGRVGPVRPSLQTMARKGMLPTPTAGDAKASGSMGYTTGNDGMTLTDATVRGGMLNTPAARDYRDMGAPAEQKRNSPSNAAILGGRLNPRFVAQMMGYPTGWLD